MARDVRETSRSAARATPAPVIHPGDALVVEEHTAVVDARLEAVALGSAAAGEELQGAVEDRRQGGARDRGGGRDGQS